VAVKLKSPVPATAFQSLLDSPTREVRDSNALCQFSDTGTQVTAGSSRVTPCPKKENQHNHYHLLYISSISRCHIKLYYPLLTFLLVLVLESLEISGIVFTYRPLDLDSSNTVSWAHPSPNPKCYLHQFSCFCRAHNHYRQADRQTTLLICSNRPHIPELYAMQPENDNNDIQNHSILTTKCNQTPVLSTCCMTYVPSLVHTCSVICILQTYHRHLML